LEARSFTAFTDHKPLTCAFAKTADPWSPRQQRHLAYISEFTTDVRHIAGKDNTVADALSRATINSISVQLGIHHSAMTAAQKSEEVKAYRTAIEGLTFQDVKLGASDETILCDISTA